MQFPSVTRLSVRSLLYFAVTTVATVTAFAQDKAEDSQLASYPHIGVILPLQSPSFGRAADSVRLGILDAAQLAPANSPRIRFYATTEDTSQVVAAYERALGLGARLVIGPLTRNGVTAIIQSGIARVPTLVLNSPEGDAPLPRNVYSFGLQIESEARQVAQWAFEKGGNRALIVAGESALDTRIAQAFAEEWKSLRGEVVGRYVFSAEAGRQGKLKEQIAGSGTDILFLALDAAQARFVRSYLGSTLPIYATSRIFVTSTDALANHDLEGVRFLDMPWLLQPDHPAVISYMRPEGLTRTPDDERLFALGVDAYRIALELLRPYERMQSLDGVTGTILLNDAQQFVRSPVPAQFSQGAARALEPPPGR